VGLDCWVARRPHEPVGLSGGEAALFGGLDLPLVEWTAEGSSVHFSGKRYLGVVEAVTGVWLSEPWLSSVTLAEMAVRFARADLAAAASAVNATDPACRELPLSLEEVSALRLLFEICAAAGLGLANDW